MNKIVLILGASRYYTESFKTLKENNFYIISVDQNPDAFCKTLSDEFYNIDLKDTDSICELFKDRKLDAVVPMNDYGVLSASIISNKFGLFGLDKDVAIRATSKSQMRKKWIEDNVSCPKIAICNGEDELIESAKIIGYPVIIKPSEGLGGGSRGVFVAHNDNQIKEMFALSNSYYNDSCFLVEEFLIADYEHSIEVLIINGKCYFIAIGDNQKMPLPFRVNQSITYPTNINDEQLNTLKIEVENAIKSIGIINGVAHVEGCTIADKFYLFELGARCGGGAIPFLCKYHSGIDEFLEFVNILCGKQTLKLNTNVNYKCIYYFITPKPGKIKSINGLDDIKKHNQVLDFEFFLKENEMIPSIKSGIDRAGFIVASIKQDFKEIEDIYKLFSIIYV